MKLASGICPVPKLLEEGVIVGLGTDGCASNNNLDLFTEIDMAAKLHKVKAMDPTVMDAITVLKMATIEGARALGMDEMIGSIEVGKRADMIVLNPSGPHLVPMYNPYSNIVYSATGGDVSHSIINGRLVMEERRLLTLDLEKVLSDAKKRSSKVKSWLSERDVR
jgi:5-methylthioadenosine/S-adenosylhomocysteine deaminase